MWIDSSGFLIAALLCRAHTSPRGCCDFLRKRGTVPMAAPTRFTFEGLEARQLLAIDAYYAFGHLVLVGDSADDVVEIEGDTASGNLLLNGSPVTPRGASAPVRSADVKSLVIYTGGGDDDVNLEFVDPFYGFREDLRVLVATGDGDDTVVGSTRADKIFGGPGDDLLRGGGGDDRISGGTGHDTISGDFGDDIVDGSAGDDVVYGGGGNDLVAGGFGNDEVRGARAPAPFFQGGDIDEEGSDTLVGGFGSDHYVFGGSAQGQFVIREVAWPFLRDRDSISFADYQHAMSLDLSSTAV